MNRSPGFRGRAFHGKASNGSVSKGSVFKGSVFKGSVTRRGPARPRGVAILMSLVVLMLLSMFMSEMFFATGLELRSMTTYRQGQQARAMARSVFRVVQIGLLLDEVIFFEGYRKVAQLLENGVSLPWDDGLLISLKIEPQDHLYNLNQRGDIQQGQQNDVARGRLFMNTWGELEVPGELADSPQQPISEEILQGLYAALADWTDKDNEDYIQFPGVLGAEESAYFTTKPEYTLKNGALDRLVEIRLVRGVRESRIPWKDWRKRFTALPRITDSAFYFPEKININIASAEEIREFLTAREVDPESLPTDSFEDIQKGINKYAQDAERIAEKFAPEDPEERKALTKKELEGAIKELGFTDNYHRLIFSTVNQYYRISLVTEVGGVQGRLEALYQVVRNADTRTGSSPTVHWVTLQ